MELLAAPVGIRINRVIIRATEIFLGVEYKLVTYPLIGYMVFHIHIFAIGNLYLYGLIAGVGITPVLQLRLVQSAKLLEVRELDSTRMHQRQLIHAVGTPLAVLHCLIPTNAYYGVEAEGRMTEIVLHIRLVVRQLVTPNQRVRHGCLHQFRCRVAKHHLHPVEILTPVEVRNLVLVHIERADSDRTT